MHWLITSVTLTESDNCRKRHKSISCVMSLRVIEDMSQTRWSLTVDSDLVQEAPHVLCLILQLNQ